MRKNDTEIVTPFDWQRYTAVENRHQRLRKTAQRANKQLTVRERVGQILANRWGNPYCKPGAA